MRRAPLLLLALLAASPIRAQEPDTLALHANLDRLRRERTALDERRDALGAELDSLDARADSLTQAIADASVTLRSARYAGLGFVPARTTVGVTLYTAPSFASPQMGQLPPRAAIEVLDLQGSAVYSFYLVRHEGRTGYVSTTYVEGGPELAARFSDPTRSRFGAPRPGAVVDLEEPSPIALAPPGRELHVGPRGGCYYVSSSGNKVYVDRSECAGVPSEDAVTGVDESNATPAYRGSSGSGPVHVRGYYRRDGTYVQPHTRSRPRN